MLPGYKRVANIAAGIYLCTLVGLIATLDPTKGNVFASDDVLLKATLTVHFLSFFAAFWAYAKAKGYSGLLGLILPFLSIVGLIILARLKDRHPSGLHRYNSDGNRSTSRRERRERIEPTVSDTLGGTQGVATGDERRETAEWMVYLIVKYDSSNPQPMIVARLAGGIDSGVRERARELTSEMDGILYSAPGKIWDHRDHVVWSRLPLDSLFTPDEYK